MPEDSSVERLKKRLYARGDAPPLHPRRELHEEAYNVSGEWLEPGEREAKEEEVHNPDKAMEALRQGRLPGDHSSGPAILSDPRVNRNVLERVHERRFGARIIRMILFASMAFFVIAAGIAFWFVWGGRHAVSCDNVRIEVSGPTMIPSGKELSLNIGITNNNQVAMRETELVIEYPDGSRSPQNSSVLLTTMRDRIGSIEKGERVRTTSRAVLYAPEQSEQEIHLSTEFHIDDSNALFTCSAVQPVRIGTAPVSMTVDGLEEISSGQELELKVNITSNAEETVPDQRLVVDYPFGFSFRSATPEPTGGGQNVWDFGDIAPQTSRTVTIKGVVSAQTTESRAMNFSLGERDLGDAAGLRTTLQKIEHPLLIARPFLSLELALNGNTNAEVAANIGETINGVLQWTNTLPYPLYDVEIEGLLKSALLDPATVVVNNGYFRSIDRTMLWTPQTLAEFKVVEPGASGNLDFSCNTYDLMRGTAVQEPSMNVSFTVRARRMEGDTPVQQTLVSQAVRTVKFDTNLQFTPTVVYGVGPFTNTGPYPPRVEQETTYTIIWNIKNTTSDMENVVVRGTLPIYVTWLNKISPSNEPLAYNPTTHEVTWTLGDVAAKTGYQSAPREVAFQVSFLPSISQRGNEPSLILNLSARGVDRFTKSVIERTIRAQNTKLSGDPYFPSEDGRVQ